MATPDGDEPQPESEPKPPEPTEEEAQVDAEELSKHSIANMESGDPTMSLPSRHYPPLNGPEGLPTPAQVEQTPAPDQQLATVGVPVTSGLGGNKTISITVPGTSAFSDVTERPAYFENSSPGAVHDTHYVMSAGGHYFDVATYTAVIDPASGANYTLRVAADDRDDANEGRCALILDGQEASTIISPKELQVLLTETCTKLLPPGTEQGYALHGPIHASQLYGSALTGREHLRNCVLEDTSAAADSDPPTASCPINIPGGGTYDLLEAETVTATAAPGQPVYEVGLDAHASDDVSADIGAEGIPDQMKIKVELTPVGGSAERYRQLPLPVFADLIATGQWTPDADMLE